MSVGGGGGRGGAAGNLNINPLPTTGGNAQTKLSATVDVGVGGKGGVAGDGDAVSVTNGADLATAGQSSKGIYAASVGGGGGDGGTASSASYSFNGICAAVTGGQNVICQARQNPQNKTTTITVALTAEVMRTSAKPCFR